MLATFERGGIARAPARQGPYPERKATRYSAKLHWYEVHTRETTSVTTTHDEPASVTYIRT